MPFLFLEAEQKWNKQANKKKDKLSSELLLPHIDSHHSGTKKEAPPTVHKLKLLKTKSQLIA